MTKEEQAAIKRALDELDDAYDDMRDAKRHVKTVCDALNALLDAVARKP